MEGRRGVTEEGGIWTSTTPVVGRGREEMLELLREAVRSPNPIHHRRTGLRSLPLQPQPSLVPQSVGMGRASGRNPGPDPSSEPPMNPEYTTPMFEPQSLTQT